ncbi:cyanoexosortase A system-associated protein [Anabaena subtropica]|uniref:Cyanoexosortase A system-associated protein n=1 Tax=Anabaena subtropica FACHB-260 TaxID=2692884 RepID=A0ABR8CSZ6_9NOST|nr:cyanoexosortase A system-associated protein [Anabaena subtropica]MBD2345494.1 cyanoexosortase A system-associated protein [Anabaena subtropica FACHB-260]
MYWKETRIKFLALIFGAGILVLGKSIFFPNTDKPKINTFVFPQEVPLGEWQASVAIPVKSLTKENLDSSTQKHYRYFKNNLPLDIQMRYLENFYHADIGVYIKHNLGIESPTVVRQKKEVGYYGVGIDKQTAYLSSCINPRGGSTFTHPQFRNNRFSEDINLNRIMPILMGQEALLDKRCLWVHLSIPLGNSSPEEAYQLLEKAWFSWYQWWQPRFPKL